MRSVVVLFVRLVGFGPKMNLESYPNVNNQSNADVRATLNKLVAGLSSHIAVKDWSLGLSSLDPARVG